jgi:hypothetical protein
LLTEYWVKYVQGLPVMKIMHSIYLILIVFLVGCGGGGNESPFVYEASVREDNPVLFSQNAIYHLESSADIAAEGDSGGLGWDTIHLAGEGAESRIFCIELEEGTRHRAQISSESESDLITIDTQTACATIRTRSGRVKVSLVHDGFSEAENVFVYQADALSRAIFLDGGGAARRELIIDGAPLGQNGASVAKNATIPKSNALVQALNSQLPNSTPMTIISATGCRSCNLENADLSGRDLQKMDFSGANLRSANVSNANLASADLFKADVTGLISDGANLSRAIWSDGLICAPSLAGVCDPFEFIVQANRAWQDTGVTLRSERGIRISAYGSWTTNPATGMVGPSGNPGFQAKQGYALPGAREGALIGRIGANVPFVIGNEAMSPPGRSGPLLLVINDDLDGRYGPGLADNFGWQRVVMQMIDP